MRLEALYGSVWVYTMARRIGAGLGLGYPGTTQQRGLIAPILFVQHVSWGHFALLLPWHKCSHKVQGDKGSKHRNQTGLFLVAYWVEIGVVLEKILILRKQQFPTFKKSWSVDPRSCLGPCRLTVGSKSLGKGETLEV